MYMALNHARRNSALPVSNSHLSFDRLAEYPTYKFEDKLLFEVFGCGAERVVGQSIFARRGADD
jgi:hypothetical protein